MLTRQKVLLLMLKFAAKPVDRFTLMKWSFLLRHECESEGGSTFYDFVPYKYGPFSFALYQEMRKLEEQSYVCTEGPHSWKLNLVLSKAMSGVSDTVKRDVKAIVREYAQDSRDELLDYVYHQYPDYTVNSELRRLAPRPKAELAVYTAGYEGVSVDGFLNLLVKSGVESLIDVRCNPVSRRYGFHKSTLNRLVSDLGIEYSHFPELGIDSEKRRRFPQEDDRGDLFDEYESTTLTDQASTIELVSQMVQKKPSVLVCMEANPDCCHRSRLAKPVADLTGLPIIHLRA
jgi:uncharacterized protein (DUF488 family)